MIRRGLLLIAATTVAAPGLLAVLAAGGHEQAGAASAAALDGARLAGAPSASRASAMAVKSDVMHAGVAASLRDAGLRLLQKAASAGLSTSYQGMEADSQSDVDGSAKVTALVWHKGGGSTLVEGLSNASPAAHPATAEPAGAATAGSGVASGSPEGVFGITTGLVGLLGEHYTASYRGTGTVANRTASVVELYRGDGSIAARYWLDGTTTVPLRRVLYDTSGHEIGDDSFIKVQFGTVTLPRPGAGAAAQPQSARAWVPAAAPGVFLASLARRGWQVPASSPGGLPLYAAASTTTATGEIVDLEYSDGLYDFSLFVQHGTLAAQLPGWQSERVSGYQVYVSGPSVTWTRDGFVYTVIADVPPQTVMQLVSGLPNGPPGVFGRLKRGFTRLVSVINPFH